MGLDASSEVFICLKMDLQAIWEWESRHVAGLFRNFLSGQNSSKRTIFAVWRFVCFEFKTMKIIFQGHEIFHRTWKQFNLSSQKNLMVLLVVFMHFWLCFVFNFVCFFQRVNIGNLEFHNFTGSDLREHYPLQKTAHF